MLTPLTWASLLILEKSFFVLSIIGGCLFSFVGCVFSAGVGAWASFLLSAGVGFLSGAKRNRLRLVY